MYQIALYSLFELHERNCFAELASTVHRSMLPGESMRFCTLLIKTVDGSVGLRISSDYRPNIINATFMQELSSYFKIMMEDKSCQFA